MKNFLSIVMLSALFVGCANSNLEITKCDKRVNDLCVKSHIDKYHRCSKPTVVGKTTYCKE